MKLFLNLSKEEQRIRFLKRIDVPERNWKFSAADARERRRWDDYQVAFSRMLSATSTEHAPVVRRPGRPQVVRPHLRRGGARPRADRRSIPSSRRSARRPVRDARRDAKRELEAEAPEGAAPDPYAAAHDGHGHHGHGARARPGGTRGASATTKRAGG